MQEMESSLNANNFPQKLWLLVNNSNIHSIVWNDQGDGIIINKNLFEKELLCLNVFRKSSFSNFVRQLNMYGFKISKRCNREKPGVRHCFQPNFKRNQPELLPLLKRGIKKSRPMLENDPQTDLAERWRGHRNLGQMDDVCQNYGEAFSGDF